MKATIFMTFTLWLCIDYTASYLVRSLNTFKPCLSRYGVVSQQIYNYGDILTGPFYIPRCEKDGINWKPTQCDHGNRGTCFCVDVETGAVIPETTRYDVIGEYISCDGGEYATLIRSCEERRRRYKKIRELYGVEHPLDYLPVCLKNGSYNALQRNDRYFFCVDINSGKQIPGTQSSHNEGDPFITEELCGNFSQLWSQYEYLTMYGDEIAGPTTCRVGTVFDECGCKVFCRPGEDMTQTEIEDCETCRPVCRCPTGSYELGGQCVSSEECKAVNIENNKKKLIKSWTAFTEENGNSKIQFYLKRLQSELFERTSDLYRRLLDGREEYSGNGFLASATKDFKEQEIDSNEESLLYDEDDSFQRVASDNSYEYEVYEEGNYSNNNEDNEDEMTARIGSVQYKKSVLEN